MAAKAVRTHGQRICAVEVSPGEVDAGAELSVSVRVACPEGCDLTGQSVSIQNQDDAELACTELNACNDDAYVTGAIPLRAPLQVGEQHYHALLPAEEKDGILHEETLAAFSFTVQAHAASLNVWDLPSAIAAGEDFKFKVGIKCSAGCNLAGRPLRVFDDEGTQVGAGQLLDIWPGTSALYFAEVEAKAPPTTGDHTWQVMTPETDTGAPHAAGSSNFTVKVVSTPDHEVTVEAFDSQTQTPIKGVHVLLHPYRAFTDENGVAKIKVAKGRYQLFVSGFNYIAYENIVDVTADVTARAELVVEPEEQVDYR